MSEVQTIGFASASNLGPAPAVKPTVGRMVYYNTRGSADGVFLSRPLAAIVTRVYEDGEISVAAFRETGLHFEMKVKQGLEPGCWDWMPFQKDQQARLSSGTDASHLVGTASAPTGGMMASQGK